MQKFKRFLAFMVGLGSTMDAFSLHAPGGRPISMGFICVGIYFLFLLFDLPSSGGIKRKFGSYYLLPVLYILVLWVSNLAYAHASGLYFPMTTFLNWLLMFFILMHTNQDEKAARSVLNGIAAGSIILVLLFVNGVGLETVQTSEGDRIGMMGMNPNDLCITISIGMIFLLNESIFKDGWHLKKARWFLIAVVALEVMMVLTIASRTGTIIISVAFLVSILTFKGVNHTAKFFIIVVGLSVLIFGVNYLWESDSIISTRMKLVLEEGDTSGRTDIWFAYLKLFPEHPFMGVGETGLIDVCRMAGLHTVTINGHETAFSPHNVIVEILMTSGLIGLSFMMLFWLKTFRNAYLDYKNNASTTSLVLIIPLVIVILSGQILTSKIAWSIYAYLITRIHRNSYNKQLT